MKHSLLQLKPLALALNSLDTLSDVRIKKSIYASLLIKTLSIRFGDSPSTDISSTDFLSTDNTSTDNSLTT